MQQQELDSHFHISTPSQPTKLPKSVYDFEEDMFEAEKMEQHACTASHEEHNEQSQVEEVVRGGNLIHLESELAKERKANQAVIEKINDVLEEIRYAIEELLENEHENTESGEKEMGIFL